ncbi:MAG: MFS transporter, partial [Conexibacter sp.]
MSRSPLLLPAAACALVPFNSTMVAVALPALQRDFAASTEQVTAVVTAYLAAMLVAQPLAGRAVERVGAASLLRGGLLAFFACSLAATVSPSLAWLASARIGQACAAACAMTSGIALVRAWSPADRLGRNLGIVSAAIPLGALLGPLVAGGLSLAGSWRLSFAANLALVPLLAVRLPPTGERPLTTSERLPRIPPEAVPVLGAASAAMGLLNLTMYVLIIVLPLALQAAQGWSPLAVGASLAAVPLSSALAAVLGGRTVDRRSSRAVALTGATLAGAGCA